MRRKELSGNRVIHRNISKEALDPLLASETSSGSQDPSGIFGQPAGSGGTVSSPEAQPYERRFSMLTRFAKLVVSPSEAMKDIAFSPDYSGPITIIILETIVATILIATFLSRINVVGAPSDFSTIWGNILSLVVGILVVLAPILYVVFWLVKSLLVQYLAGSGSGWNFKTAASVTGYAYIADLIFSIITTVVVLSLTPSLTITYGQDQSQVSAQLISQIGWIATFSIPLNLIAIIWKSYLGGLGTHFGTNEKCSIGKAFVIFVILALIGLALNLATRRY